MSVFKCDKCGNEMPTMYEIKELDGNEVKSICKFCYAGIDNPLKAKPEIKVEVSAEKAPEVKEKVVVVAGGGTVGCETALYLATSKNTVIIAEMLDDLALDMDPINRMELLEKIEDSNIKVLLGRKLTRIEQGSVILSRLETEGGGPGH